jgi:hypothetical protein
MRNVVPWWCTWDKTTTTVLRGVGRMKFSSKKMKVFRMETWILSPEQGLMRADVMTEEKINNTAVAIIRNLCWEQK